MKEIKKKSDSKTHSTSENIKEKNENNSNNTSTLVVAILILVILNVLLSFSIILTKETPMHDSQIKNIESKVNAIDNFFRENIPEYDPDYVAGNDNMDSTNSGDISADDDPMKGSVDAPVTIIEFSDFQCPFCRKYYEESYLQLKEDYIDTGKVKYVFRDFPLNFHPVAIPAAVAANCVREQEGDVGYFAIHDKFFDEQAKLGTGTVQFTQSDIDKWVSEVYPNLDMTAYETCLDDPAQIEEIQNDLKDGTLAGVSGTPSFFINGIQLVGAQPYSVIKQTIEKELSKQ